MWDEEEKKMLRDIFLRGLGISLVNVALWGGMVILILWLCHVI